jgi:hypothetical protein
MPQVTGRVAQVVEFLPSKCEALRSSQGTAKKKKKKRKKEKEMLKSGASTPRIPLHRHPQCSESQGLFSSSRSKFKNQQNFKST